MYYRMKLDSSLLTDYKVTDAQVHFCEKQENYQGAWATDMQPRSSVYLVYCLLARLAVN